MEKIYYTISQTLVLIKKKYSKNTIYRLLRKNKIPGVIKSTKKGKKKEQYFIPEEGIQYILTRKKENQIISKIEQVQQECNLSLKEIAQRTGISYNVLRNISSNRKVKPSLEEAVLLERYFNIPLTKWLEGK